MAVWIFAMLAVSDGLVIGQWVYNGIMTVVMAYVALKQRKIESLEENLSRKAEELVETQIQVQVAMLKGLITPIATELSQCMQRLRDGEQVFGELSDRDQQIELHVAAKFDALKDFLRKELVTSEELDRHEKREGERFGTIERQIRELGAAVVKHG